ncbi:MAG: hypothetical protein ACRDTA_13330 [Pseudonocardiaceae bacterium]
MGGVDPKTIERWIGDRIPYRRHRYRAASRLGIDEAYLWPGALAAEQVASASESEILVLYPHRWAVPRDIWGQLFDSAEEEIGVLVYSGLFIADDPGLLALSGPRPRRESEFASCSATRMRPRWPVAARSRGSVTRWHRRSAM